MVCIAEENSAAILKVDGVSKVITLSQNASGHTRSEALSTLIALTEHGM